MISHQKNHFSLLLGSLVVLTLPLNSVAQTQEFSEVFDLRPGVERIYDLCSQSAIAPCVVGSQVYRHEVVDEEVQINGSLYSKVYSHLYNDAFYMYTDTLYFAMREGKLIEFKNGEEHVKVDFSFTINDSLKHFVSSESPEINNLVVLADTLATFPDDLTYRVVYMSANMDSSISNAHFVMNMLTSDLVETSGYGAINGWLLPFGDDSILEAQPLQVTYFVSRFGFVFSPSDDGVLVAFRSHDGMWYGADAELFPRVPTHIRHTTEEIPHSFAMSAYPNPFNPTTTIRFELPSTMHVNLSVFNLLGSKIDELATEQLPAGVHHFVFDASGLSSGMYIYQLNTSLGVQSGKIMLIK